MKLGIIREFKIPPDSRVPIAPEQCKHIQDHYSIEVKVQSSPNRCFSDEDYQKLGINICDDVSDCDVLLGVKEVPIENLIPNKTYFFFSHTIKEQAYNRKLLQAILNKNIQLVDYEVLRDSAGKRVIAFGRFAGMVGAHNGIMTYGKRTGSFDLKRMKDCEDYEEAKAVYKTLELPAIKIVLTGTGRVGNGAAEVLKDMGIREVDSQAFLNEEFQEPVFTQLKCFHYAARKDEGVFNKKDFYESPEDFKSIFQPYFGVADVMINGIYWDNNAPAFFTTEDMKKDSFKIQVVADVTCDIAPVSSIPSTLKASTIADPVFGYDPNTGLETPPYQQGSIDMMTIDNLPNEMPKDASKSFGNQFLEHVMKELFKKESEMLEQATVAKAGDLGKHFEYLRDYVNGR